MPCAIINALRKEKKKVTRKRVFKKKKANKQTLEDAAEPPCSRNKTPGGCNSSGSATPDRSFQLSLLTAERFLGEKRQAEKRGGCGRSEDLILENLHSKGNPSALHLHLRDTQKAQSSSPQHALTPLAPRHTQVQELEESTTRPFSFPPQIDCSRLR